MAKFRLEQLTVEHLRALNSLNLTPFITPHAFAAVKSGYTIAAAGIVQYGPPGVGYCWFDRGVATKRDMAFITDIIGEYINFYLINGDYRRLEMRVSRNDEVAMRWAKRLGFIEEGINVGYFDKGNDAVMYGAWQWMNEF